MKSRHFVLAAATALSVLPVARSTGENRFDSLWGRICSYTDGESAGVPLAHVPSLPPAQCPPIPSGYQSLPSVGDGTGDTSADLAIGYDLNTKRLCFVSTGLPQAPVLRVATGHALSVQIANTLKDSGKLHTQNCPIDTYGGEGLCEPKLVFPEAPGADGSFYPLMANEAHTADGTSNLHVHGLFVPPVTCSDEVLHTAIYPTNWLGPVAPLPPCQSAPDDLSYTYQLPADHPAGAYWYHTHRHGQAEHQSQMGLIGAIVVEDAGDVYRASIGVTDEVLLVGDVPNPACLVGPSCDARVGPKSRRQDNAAAARAAARASAAQVRAGQDGVVLDPRIDQVDQAGECAYGAGGKQGGVELWTLLLNGAPVPENQNGGFPPDSELLAKSMQPGQRQIFRLVNGAANSFVAPELVLNHEGVETVLPLEVFARDGVGLADAQGNRRFGYFDVARKQLIVPPAGRVEFVVHAPAPGDKLYVQSSEVDPGCGGNAYPARRLLLVTSAGTPVNPGDPFDQDLLVNTPSLAPYLATLGDHATVHRTFVLSEYGRGFTYGVTHWLKKTPLISQYDPSQTDFFITETAATDDNFNPQNTAVIPFTHGTGAQAVVHLHGRQSVTEEWLIENSTLEIHAFHMHQVHFQDVTTDSPNPDDHPLLDVITVPAAPLIGDVATGYPGAPGFVKLRMTFTTADIGEFVFHCHILEHEDNGMMAKIRVVAD